VVKILLGGVGGVGSRPRFGGVEKKIGGYVFEWWSRILICELTFIWGGSSSENGGSTSPPSEISVVRTWGKNDANFVGRAKVQPYRPQ